MTLHFKLDENLSPSLKVRLAAAGHDVMTVADQGLAGSEDARLAEICRTEKRCLVTADEGFAQIFQYPPEQHAGIVILRHPKPNLAALKQLMSYFVTALGHESPVGRLWIVEPGRVRIHGS